MLLLQHFLRWNPIPGFKKLETPFWKTQFHLSAIFEENFTCLGAALTVFVGCVGDCGTSVGSWWYYAAVSVVEYSENAMVQEGIREERRVHYWDGWGCELERDIIECGEWIWYGKGWLWYFTGYNNILDMIRWNINLLSGSYTPVCHKGLTIELSNILHLTFSSLANWQRRRIYFWERKAHCCCPLIFNHQSGKEKSPLSKLNRPAEPEPVCDGESISSDISVCIWCATQHFLEKKIFTFLHKNIGIWFKYGPEKSRKYFPTIFWPQSIVVPREVRMEHPL